MKKIFFLVLALCASLQNGYSQNTQWGELKPGPYEVGYKLVNEIDHGRYVQPKVDFEGKPVEAQRALKIQINIWYPAKAGNGKRMLFEDYLYISGQRETFTPFTEQQKLTAAANFKAFAKFGSDVDLTDDQLQKILKTPVPAVQGANNLDGTFPVILVGPDAGGPHSNNVLYEYLASLGFVVIVSPAQSHIATLQANNPAVALAERISTLEYLMRLATTLPYCDVSKVGILGVNFDGMTALLFQMKNMQADAIASLDGWEGAEGSKNSVLESSFFDANKMRVPYFLVKQDEKDPRGGLVLSETVFDTLKYAERYYHVLHDMNHLALIAQQNFQPTLPASKKIAYQFLYTSIGKFFEASLKKSQTSLSFIKNTAAQNGFPATVSKVEKKKVALPAVPTASEFEALIMTEQFEKAKRIVKDARSRDPFVKMFDSQLLNLLSFRFGQQKKPESVLAIRQIGVEAFPKSYRAMNYLGDAYAALGNISEARISFEKANQLIDHDPDFTAEDRRELHEQQAVKIEKVGK